MCIRDSVSIMADPRYGREVLADKRTEYSRTCSVKNAHAVHAYQYSIVDKVGDCLQCFIATHTPHIDILFETEFLFVHLIMCLAADKCTLGNPFRLLDVYKRQNVYWEYSLCVGPSIDC